MKIAPLISQFIKPLILLGVTVVYFLGVGLARYLGFGLDWGKFALGYAWIITMHIGAFFLYEYFRSFNPGFKIPPGRRQGVPAESDLLIYRRNVLLCAYACLAVLASLTVLVIARIQPNPVLYLMMILLFLGSVFYSIPPVKLEASGYGELVLAFLLGLVAPALAFIMQANELHRLVAMTTFPLVFIVLSMLIALEFEGYSTDLKYGRKNLLMLVGWSQAMNLHNILILTGYLLIGIATFFGMPNFAALAAALSLPFGLLQVYQMWRIGQGGRPNWRLLRLNALATFGALAYLLTFSFWMH